MRALIWITLAAALAYGGYWGVGSRLARSNIEAALGDLRAEGRAEYSGLSLAGFPSRFDLTVTDPALTSPDGWTRWAAPFVQVFALAYRPNHLIAVWPDRQTLRLGAETIAITSTDMRASAVFAARSDLALDRSSLVATGLALSSDAGWGVAIAEARLATRQSGETSHTVGLEITGAEPSPPLRQLLDPEGKLPPTLERIHLDADAVFDRPLDRFAGGARLEGIELRDLTLDWGGVKLSLSGALTVGAEGYLEGRLRLHASDWRAVYRVVVALSTLKPEIVPTIEAALAQQAETAGSGDALELPLIFSGGRISLGPLPLGPAPRF